MTDFKPHTCCFTGHRDIPAGEEAKIRTRLRYRTEKLYNQGYRYFGVGGAIGFDTLAAEWLLDFRESHHLIRIIGVYPFPGYRLHWTEAQRACAEALDRRLDKITYCEQTPSRGAFLARDRHLVDCSSACICYCTRAAGGTAYTVKYALEHGLPVYNTSSFDVRQLFTAASY